MPADMKKGILETFARFPAYTFLWKYEEEDMEMVKGYKNVKLVKWAPQVDLLGHPKLKAFITHAGYNSMMEAAVAGKPMITVPLFADQFRNSQASKRQGISLEVDKTKIGRDESLYEALNDILSNAE
uniref:UDP-glucuronosyltransferase n=1 Tax=Plectus sambesii TaxID=2011161 RepID=A0A914UVQ1_9BILA